MNIIASHDGVGSTRLTVAGELDMATVGDLDHHVGAEVDPGRCRRLVIDVAGVTFCDSSGVHALLRARDAAHRRGVAFVITNPSGITRRTLEITGVLASLTALR